jgi:hypothetical protein
MIAPTSIAPPPVVWLLAPLIVVHAGRIPFSVKGENYLSRIQTFVKTNKRFFISLSV